MKFREVHGEPGPNCTGPGPNIGTILKDFLGTISATERDYFRIVPTFKVVSLKSAWYGPFLTQGYKTCDAQGEKETY